MTANGRNIQLLKSWPNVDETVWVPMIRDLVWRDDEQDRKPDTEDSEDAA